MSTFEQGQDAPSRAISIATDLDSTYIVDDNGDVWELAYHFDSGNYWKRIHKAPRPQVVDRSQPNQTEPL